jgi:hypothetical protein
LFFEAILSKRKEDKVEVEARVAKSVEIFLENSIRPRRDK